MIEIAIAFIGAFSLFFSFFHYKMERTKRDLKEKSSKPTVEWR